MQNTSGRSVAVDHLAGGNKSRASCEIPALFLRLAGGEIVRGFLAAI
jgi:hypothetical protein